MRECSVLYMPVLHEGYYRFLKTSSGPIYLLGEGVLDSYRDIVKDIRAVSSAVMIEVVKQICPERPVEVVDDVNKLKQLNNTLTIVFIADEKITRDIAELYFPKAKLVVSTIFLRWDSVNSLARTPILTSKRVSAESLYSEWFSLAYTQAQQSGDWWRQVGAVVVTSQKEILTAHNQHVPSAQQPYVDGDPRASFKKGINIEIGTVLHAEMAIIAEAARRGIGLAGAELFVTTFPCAWCAKILAYCGMSKLYYIEGYTNLDAQSILENQGVEIVKVEI